MGALSYRLSSFDLIDRAGSKDRPMMAREKSLTASHCDSLDCNKLTNLSEGDEIENRIERIIWSDTHPNDELNQMTLFSMPKILNTRDFSDKAFLPRYTVESGSLASRIAQNPKLGSGEKAGAEERSLRSRKLVAVTALLLILIGLGLGYLGFKPEKLTEKGPVVASDPVEYGTVQKSERAQVNFQEPMDVQTSLTMIPLDQLFQTRASNNQ